MNTLLELQPAERGTGVAITDWFLAQFPNTESSTAQRFPAKVIYINSFAGQSNRPDLFERGQNVTDPNAQKRSIGNEIAQMAAGLSNLASAARLLIPGLREMGSAERANLRQYYKSLYRKA